MHWALLELGSWELGLFLGQRLDCSQPGEFVWALCATSQACQWWEGLSCGCMGVSPLGGEHFMFGACCGDVI